MSVLRASALLGGAQIWYKITAFAVFAVAARVVPAGELGELFTAMAFSGVFAVAVGLGMPTLVMRRVARAPETAGDELAGLVGLRLATLVPFIALIGVAGAFLRGELWPLWAAAALIVAGEDAYTSVGAVFLGLSRPRVNVAIGVGVQTVFAAVAVAAMVATGAVEGLVGAQAARVAALMAVAWWVARRLLGAPAPRLRRAVLVGAAPFAVAAGLRGIAEQADAVVVGMLASPEEMACYQLALRTLAATTFAPYAVAAAVVPAVGRAGLAAPRVVWGATAGLVGLGALAALPLILAPDLVGRLLFGELGAGVAPLLTAVAPLAPLWFASIFLTSVLQAAGRERAAVALLGVGAALNLAVSIPGTLAWGPAGAVVARGVAALAQVGLAAHLIWRASRSPR